MPVDIHLVYQIIPQDFFFMNCLSLCSLHRVKLRQKDREGPRNSQTVATMAPLSHPPFASRESLSEAHHLSHGAILSANHLQTDFCIS